MQRDERKPDERSKVFASFAPNKAAKMMRKDLEAAGITYRDEASRVADFHALRHTFISNLTRSGVSPKIAQSLARHSTIGLTMDTYTHIGLYDERTALDSLPELPSLDGDKSRDSSAAAVRTGTDDLPVAAIESDYKPAYKKLTKNAYPDMNDSSSNGNTSENERGNRGNCKSLVAGMLDNSKTEMSSIDTTEQEGFEPPVPVGTTVFKTVAFSRSATAPQQRHYYINSRPCCK